MIVTDPRCRVERPVLAGYDLMRFASIRKRAVQLTGSTRPEADLQRCRMNGRFTFPVHCRVQSPTKPFF